MMKALNKFNIFTILMVVASVCFAFRLVNLFTASPRGDAGNIVMSAQAEGSAGTTHEESDEQAPPLTKEDLDKAVKATANDLEGGITDDTAKKAAAAAASPSAQAPLPDNRAFSASELDVLQSLSQRRDELDTRERALTEREALLQAAEKEVDRKVNELNTLKGEIEKLLGQQSKMESDRIVSLVRIYENMKPKEAATIFNTLDMDVLLSVVGRMNERKLSPILASMDPEKARIVTIRLAEQRKLPGAPEGDAATPAP